MNWEMISAVGQMLGAMKVLTTHWSDLNRSLVENPELAALWIRALRSFDELEGVSKLRFGAHLGRFLRFADSLYLGVLDGTLDKRLWRGYERTTADTVAIQDSKSGGSHENTGTPTNSVR